MRSFNSKSDPSGKRFNTKGSIALSQKQQRDLEKAIRRWENKTKPLIKATKQAEHLTAADYLKIVSTSKPWPP